MRYWKQIDSENKVTNRIAMNKETALEDFKWIAKNLGGNWVLEKESVESSSEGN